MSVIPKEKLAGFQRWHLNSFDQKPVVSTAPIPTPVIAETIAQPLAPLNEVALPTAEDVEQIREEARKTGYEAGFEEGRAVAEKASQEAAQETSAGISTLIANIEKALAELDQSVANQILDLALEVATQISRGAIRTKTDYLLPIIREAITGLPLHHAHITLHLNPADASNVRTGMGEQIGQHNMQIIEDEDISLGGCRLRAGSSEVDATTETRWSRVLEAIGAEPREWLNQS